MNTSVRQSNFELLRIISMLMVLICHANGYVNQDDMVGAEGVIRVVINQLFLICVNVFVMISGWFGIKTTWRGAGSLLFQTIFWGLAIAGVFALIGLPVSLKKDILPCLLFGYEYWFVVSYLILFAIAPVLNQFCENASKREFQGALIAFFLAEFIYGFLLNAGHFASGFSPLFFIGLYLLARYVRLYPGRLFSFKKGYDITIYLVISVISIFGLWFGYKWFGMGFHLNHYDSPLAIAAALFFLLFFSKLQFQSKTINWLAISAFAIYLIHENSLVSPFYRKLVLGIKDAVPLEAYYPLLFVTAILIGLLCILIDKPRILAWNKLLSILQPRKK